VGSGQISTTARVPAEHALDERERPEPAAVRSPTARTETADLQIDGMHRASRVLRIERELVAIGFTPEHVGEYEFRCGKGMLRGRVLAR
jgi:hypothetical protein